jgi:hypothetical protein
MRYAVRAALTGCALSYAVAAGAQQSSVRNFTVTPVVGLIHWDDASALANKSAAGDGRFTKRDYNPTVGLSAEYSVVPMLGVGFYFEASRPMTRGDYFPSAFFDYGTRADVYVVSQRVTVRMYGVQATLGTDVSRLHPYVTGGVGAVTLTLDPQQNDANKQYSTGQFQLGGGLGYRVGRSVSVTADVRDFVFTSWDRDELNPVRPAFQNTRLPAVNANPPAEKNTVHNIRLAIGFSFVPRGNAEEPPVTGTSPTTTP